MAKKLRQIFLILLLLLRIGFIFFDLIKSKDGGLNIAFFSENKNSKAVSHFSATNVTFPSSLSENSTLELENTDTQEKQIEKIQKTTESKILDNLDVDNISLNTISKVSNKMEVLDTLYRKTNDENVLKVLINELLASYQFDKVKEYLANIDIYTSSVIDKKSYIYTYVNTLSITDLSSMTNFEKLVENLKGKNLITYDEYLFYKGLAKIWNKDYDVALETMKQISSETFSGFVGQLESTITSYKNQKGMPSYYEDALISLLMMKNGYFSIANKLAVETVLQDKKYILPYQVLAYSNFLTHNWDKSISYFYDLSSLDIENKSKYDFYLGISYYWKGDYSNSLTTLYQLVNNSTYKVDVYRYMLLNYEKLGQIEKMAQIWQKLLGEYGLEESDFKYFFDVVFFKPFSQGQDSEIYQKYTQMSYDVVETCYDKFGNKNDTCIYGEVGFDIVNGLWSSIEENLLYLSENYPQASVFQALGDYYKRNNDKDLAKKYYLKAISLTQDSAQESLVRTSLLSTVY